MTRPTTTPERLARIETLLETLPEIKDDIKAIRDDLDKDKAELAALKNKGTGILVGVALAAGSAGAGVLKLWQGLTGS
jgi:hypothetical protein